MKAYWLVKNKPQKDFIWFGKEKPKKLIVFFAGWSFDYNSFRCIKSEDYDVLMIYDYNDLTVPQELKNLSGYSEKHLVAWSMGVYVAYKLKALFQEFDSRIAVNGTVTPIDDNYGIPDKIFGLTLKHARKGLEGKFYQNVFNNEDEYETFNIMPIKRSIDNRVSELENLQRLIKNDKDTGYVKFYDWAAVGCNDKIIPPVNQVASHEKNGVPVYQILDVGHFPFFSYCVDWNDVLKWPQTLEL